MSLSFPFCLSDHFKFAKKVMSVHVASYPEDARDQKSWFEKDLRREIMLALISNLAFPKIARRLAFLSLLSPAIGSFIVSERTCACYIIQATCSAFRSIALRLGWTQPHNNRVYIRTTEVFASLSKSCQPRIISIYIFMRHATRIHRGNRMHQVSKDESHILESDAEVQCRKVPFIRLYQIYISSSFYFRRIDFLYQRFLILCKRFCLVVVNWRTFHAETFDEKN